MYDWTARPATPIPCDVSRQVELPEQHRQGVVDLMVTVHQSVQAYSDRFEAELRYSAQLRVQTRLLNLIRFPPHKLRKFGSISSVVLLCVLPRMHVEVLALAQPRFHY
jgi:hypothetical protein